MIELNGVKKSFGKQEVLKDVSIKVEDGEVVGARDDAAHGIAPVGQGVADDVAEGVARAVGGAADELGTAVAVEVVDHELGVVGAGADVFTKVDTPEECTIR